MTPEPGPEPGGHECDEGSRAAAERSYQEGRRYGRRISVLVLGGVVAFDFVVGLLAAGWVVAVSLAVPQVVFVIVMYRRPLRPNPYAPSRGGLGSN